MWRRVLPHRLTEPRHASAVAYAHPRQRFTHHPSWSDYGVRLCCAARMQTCARLCICLTGATLHPHSTATPPAYTCWKWRTWRNRYVPWTMFSCLMVLTCAARCVVRCGCGCGLSRGRQAGSASCVRAYVRTSIDRCSWKTRLVSAWAGQCRGGVVHVLLVFLKTARCRFGPPCDAPTLQFDESSSVRGVRVCVACVSWCMRVMCATHRGGGPQVCIVCATPLLPVGLGTVAPFGAGTTCLKPPGVL